ncbi:IclR family transcriptional regulator [Candidatus Halobonum tyrrellensis]|uniref:IclR family transcriptional regulator n=1 Tax=Candidatus Halobonum tyrrellensis G22 TaxID=1324957 RepID=V4GXG8_9EURY|nr:IclR family transcriptional regulator [Candidatus Halobonum tyrrellensis]ESP89836.1 IclR family transcriptional regulator [Candidatus Halobonum tyrrellensis G22]
MIEDTTEGAKRIKSVERAFAVVDTLYGSGCMRIAEVADALDLATSTAHVHLKTLESAGYTVKEPDGYRLSFRFLRNGIAIQESQELYQAARSPTAELACDTEEVVSLGVEEDGLRVILGQAEGEKAVYDNAQVGEYENMHCTALGKAILAYCSREYTEKVIEYHGLPQRTDLTLSERDELIEELETVKERGYALEDEERRYGIRSVAVPVLSDDTPLGAISVSGPKKRLTTDRIRDQLLQKLQSTVNVVEVEYTYD